MRTDRIDRSAPVTADAVLGEINFSGYALMGLGGSSDSSSDDRHKHFGLAVRIAVDPNPTSVVLARCAELDAAHPLRSYGQRPPDKRARMRWYGSRRMWIRCPSAACRTIDEELELITRERGSDQ